jgi:hypothetical protein
MRRLLAYLYCCYAREVAHFNVCVLWWKQTRPSMAMYCIHTCTAINANNQIHGPCPTNSTNHDYGLKITKKMFKYIYSKNLI